MNGSPERRGRSADEGGGRAQGFDQAGAESEFARMLAPLVAASREFIGVADLEGNALFVNEAGRRLVGLPDLAAVRSTQIIDYFAADDRPKVLQEVLPAVRKTGFWEGELRFQNFATGELVPVLYNVFPVRDASGGVAAYGTVSRNLTEDKLVEQRLQSLASIVESSDDAIVSKSLEGIIRTWNRGAERIFGYTAEEAIGRSITIVIPEDRRNEEIEILNRIRRGERIDPSTIPVDLHDRPAFDRTVLAAVRDVGWGRTASYGAIARRTAVCAREAR